MCIHVHVYVYMYIHVHCVNATGYRPFVQETNKCSFAQSKLNDLPV